MKQKSEKHVVKPDILDEELEDLITDYENRLDPRAEDIKFNYYFINKYSSILTQESEETE